jgi:hypothetical protein
MFRIYLGRGVSSAPSHYVLNAEAGVFTLTGTDVSLIKHSKLIASPGTFTLTGTNVDLIANLHGGGGVGNIILHGPQLLSGSTWTHASLESSASSLDNIYVGNILIITDGPGTGQAKKIRSYDGDAKRVYIEGSWYHLPDSTSEYVVVPSSSEYLIRPEETAQGGGAYWITLNSAASSDHNVYVGETLVIVDGTGAGQSEKITQYNGTNKKAIMRDSWFIYPDNTSQYVIVP